MATKIKRPTSFKYETFEWKIIYNNQDATTHGETFVDSKEVIINIKGLDEEVIKDTLLHELLHVISENVFKALGDMEEVKFYDKEEHYVRFVTPRLNVLMKNNTQLVEYLWS